MQLIWSTPWGVRRCEAVRYSAFGVPTAIASGDFDGDGDEDSEDSDFMLNLLAQNPVPYSVVADMDLDGDIDEDDDALQLLTSGGGRGLLSTSGVANRRGYAGYEHDWAIDSLCHVRHRVYLPALGRWTRRDPLGYVEGMSLYAYVANRAVVRTDEMGLYSKEGGGNEPIGTDGPIPYGISPPGGGNICFLNSDGELICAGAAACGITDSRCAVDEANKCETTDEVLQCYSSDPVRCERQAVEQAARHCKSNDGIGPKQQMDSCKLRDSNCACAINPSPGLPVDCTNTSEGPWMNKDIKDWTFTIDGSGILCSCRLTYTYRKVSTHCHGLCR